MTRIGYQLSSLKPKLTTPEEVREALERLGAMVCTTLQVQWVHPSVPDEAVAEALRDNGMTCLGVQDKFPAVRESWDRMVNQNRLWGGTDLCISGIPAQDMTLPGLERYAGELTAMAERLAEEGMTLSFHPVWADYAPVEGISALDRLLETVPRMGLTLCVYHVVKAGRDPVELLEKYRGRVGVIHCKDYQPGEDGDVLIPTGQGVVDWPPVLAACRRNGVSYALIEQERWEKDPFRCAWESLEYLRAHGLETEKQGQF